MGAASTNVANCLTLNMSGENESTTFDRTRPIRVSPANPAMLSRIIAKVHGYPPFTENPMHWGDIKSFLARTWGGVKATAGFVNEHKSWLLPALGAIAALV